MNKKLKVARIAAREVLIMVGIAVYGFLLAFTADYLFQHSKIYIKWMTPALYEYDPLSFKLAWHRALLLFSHYNFPAFPHELKSSHHIIWSLWTEHLGEFILLYGPLIYLFIRSIVWAGMSNQRRDR